MLFLRATSTGFAKSVRGLGDLDGCHSCDISLVWRVWAAASCIMESVVVHVHLVTSIVDLFRLHPMQGSLIVLAEVKHHSVRFAPIGAHVVAMGGAVCTDSYIFIKTHVCNWTCRAAA